MEGGWDWVILVVNVVVLELPLATLGVHTLLAVARGVKIRNIGPAPTVEILP